MEIDELVEARKSAIKVLDSMTSEYVLAKYQQVLVRALVDHDQTPGAVVRAARRIMRMFHTDLTGRYVPPLEPGELERAVGAVVFMVVPDADIISGAEASRLLGKHRQSLPYLVLRHPDAFTPLWKGDGRVYLRHEVVSYRYGEEDHYAEN